MPIERGSDKRRTGSPVRGAGSPFRIRIPDLAPARQFAGQAPARPTTAPAPRLEAPPRAVDDPVARARAKLSERKIVERREDVPTMIAGMRNRRRKFLDRLWIASIVLTALSVVALGVELLHELPVGTSAGESSTSDAEKTHSAEIARSRNTRTIQPVSGVAARAWSNELPGELPGELPEENAVKTAHYTTDGTGGPTGALLNGTISDSDPDGQQPGATHGGPQSSTP